MTLFGPVGRSTVFAREGGALRNARYLRDKRICEALLFASSTPVSEEDIAAHLGSGAALDDIIAELAADYAGRGVNLVRVAGKWAFRTAEDLGYLLARDREEPRKLSRAALETLAIIAYHQPVTRGEMEAIRGVSTSKGTLDVLIETGWIRLRGRRRTPGRPVTFGTTPAFLDHFGFDALSDLPGLSELKGAGFFDGRLPADIEIPTPDGSTALQPGEDPLDEDMFVLLAEERAAATDDPLELEA